MKKVTRADLRGKPLDRDCYDAHTTTNEYGKEDNRVYCLGLGDKQTDELLKKCLNCKANVIHAEPLSGGSFNAGLGCFTTCKFC
jgi:hypothetical protein